MFWVHNNNSERAANVGENSNAHSSHNIKLALLLLVVYSGVYKFFWEINFKKRFIKKLSYLPNDDVHNIKDFLAKFT